MHLGRLLLPGPEQRVHGETVRDALHAPHVVVRQDAHGPGGESVPQPLPGPPPVVQHLGAPGPESGGGLPVELAARLGRGVDERDPHAPRAGRERGGEPGGPGTDHGEVGALLRRGGPGVRRVDAGVIGHGPLLRVRCRPV